MEPVVYDTLNDGGYLVDGALGVGLLALAGIAAIAGLALLVIGARRSRHGRAAIGAGVALLVAGIGGAAAMEAAPLRDRRWLADGRYDVLQGTVLAVSQTYVAVDNTRFGLRCGAACPLPSAGDRVRVAYRRDDDMVDGQRALRIWRLPALPIADPAPSETPATYAPAEAARPTAASPTTRSSGGLTIRLIPGTLGQ